MKTYIQPITICQHLALPLMNNTIGSGAKQEDARAPQRSRLYI